MLKDYPILMETMAEINSTTHDEYGLKAGAILTALEKFGTLFGLKLGRVLSAAAEEVSESLQAKDTTLQTALSAVNLASAFYRRQRTHEAFNRIYDSVVETAQHLVIGEPQLPRNRRPPARIDAGCHLHRFSSPRDYYRQLYFQACNLLLRELTDRFDQKELLPQVLGLESFLIKAANGENYDDVLRTVEDSCYAPDLDFTKLRRHLPLLVDVAKEGNIGVHKVTSIRTICEAMNANPTHFIGGT